MNFFLILLFLVVCCMRNQQQVMTDLIISVDIVPTISIEFKLDELPSLVSEIGIYQNDKNSTDYGICEEKCGENAEFRYCSCDSLCEKFGDCCFDYWAKCTNQLTDLKTRDLNPTAALVVSHSIAGYKQAFDTCVDMLFNDILYSIKQISSCPTDSLQSTILDYNSLCLNELQSTAYDITTKLLFKNAYCALCNGVQTSSLKILQPSASCLNNHTCGMFYTVPDDLVEYRTCGASKGYLDCNYIANSLISNTLAEVISDIGILEKDLLQIDTLDYELKLYTSLCGLYVMPYSLQIINNEDPTASILLTFQNVHCIKCWLINQGFYFTQIRHFDEKTLAGFKYEIHVTSINREIKANPRILPADLSLSTPVKMFNTSLYQNATFSVINEIDDQYRPRNNNSLQQLFNSDFYTVEQFLFKHLVRYEYDFTIRIDFVIEADFLKKFNILTDVADASVYKGVFDEYFLTKVMTQYQIDTSVYRLELNLTSADQIVTIRIPLRFTDMILVGSLNAKLKILLQIFEKLLLDRDYGLYNLSRGTYIDRIELVNDKEEFMPTSKCVYYRDTIDYNEFMENNLVMLTDINNDGELEMLRLNTMITGIFFNYKNFLNYTNIYKLSFQVKEFLMSSEQPKIDFQICYDPNLNNTIWFNKEQYSMKCDEKLLFVNDMQNGIDTNVKNTVSVYRELKINSTIVDVDVRLLYVMLRVTAPNYQFIRDVTNWLLACVNDTQFLNDIKKFNDYILESPASTTKSPASTISEASTSKNMNLLNLSTNLKASSSGNLFLIILFSCLWP